MIKKLLFKLHLRSSYPTYLTGLDGSKVPCNVIRVDEKSSNIRPMIEKAIADPNTHIHISVYTPPEKS